MAIENTNTWVNIFKNNFSEILSLLEVLLIGIYVVYTKRTFNQIKKQTDSQLNAYLHFDSFLLKEAEIKSNSKINLTAIDDDFNTDWKESMKNAFPELKASNIFEGDYYTIKFTNYGNSEVKNLNLEIKITISNSEDSIKNKKLTKSETKTKKITFCELIQKGETIELPLFSTASFPNYIINTNGNYIDVRNTKYNIEPINYSNSNKHLN